MAGGSEVADASEAAEAWARGGEFRFWYRYSFAPEVSRPAELVDA